MKLNRRVFTLAIATILSTQGTVAFAQSIGYPNKPVRVIVPYAAGGGTDMYARMVSQELTGIWKNPVVVENKLGAAGVVALQSMLASPADGYTMTVIAASVAVNSLINPSLPYKDSDITPVVNLVSSPNVLYVGASSNYKTVRELIEDAKRNPGKISYGTTGNGTIQHIVGEKLRMQEKLDIQAIPYKGAMPIINDVMGGQIPMAFSTVAEIHTFVKAGKLRALAVMDKKRSSMLPDVPTMEESGYLDLESKLWWGIVVPKNTPANVISAINRDVNTVLKNPVIRQRIEESGGTVEGGSVQNFENQISSYRRQFGPVIKAAGITNN
ncbi:MAG: tripartite tricarboxylate transporter substrate binding protein [Burkholderiales bacterium]|nr:tripartite tricarboxylate transporter substrate binding protein [Burkholderiales bacterium]